MNISVAMNMGMEDVFKIDLDHLNIILVHHVDDIVLIGPKGVRSG